MVAVLECFSEVKGLDEGFLRKISDGARDFEDASDDTSGEIEFGGSGFDEGLSVLGEGDVFFEVLGRDFGVGFEWSVEETLGLGVASLLDTGSNYG